MTGIRVRTGFQRRSGDILTLIGNTLITMVSLCFTHDYLNNAIGGVFVGDDCLTFLKAMYGLTD